MAEPDAVVAEMVGGPLDGKREAFRRSEMPDTIDGGRFDQAGPWGEQRRVTWQYVLEPGSDPPVFRYRGPSPLMGDA